MEGRRHYSGGEEEAMNLDGCNPIDAYILTALYERVPDHVKAGVDRICEFQHPQNWPASMRATIYDRLKRAADEVSDSLTIDQKERAAIMEYDAYCPRWHAEDRALGRRRCPLEGPEIESQETAAGLWCEYACET